VASPETFSRERENKGRSASLVRALSLLMPYITVGIGMLLFHNAWVAILSYHLGMVLVVGLSRTRVPLRTVFRANNCRIPLWMGVIGACGGLLFYLLWPLLLIKTDVGLYLQRIGLTAETWPYFLAYFIMVNPLIEEYYWRGHLGQSSRRIVLGDLMFSGYHVIVLAGEIKLVWLSVMFLSLLLGAWLWRQSDRLSAGLLPSVSGHLTADITIILAIYWLTAR
jgi:hypothetical protein